MKKFNFNDYIPEELVDNESCRLITEEQYKEWKRIDGENEELANQLSKVNLLWEKTIKEKKVLQKKLEIATKALEELEIKSDKFDSSWSIQEQLDFIKAKCQETLYQLKEMEEV